MCFRAVPTADATSANDLAGGSHSSGPVALLSGLNPQPSSLVAHFFMVALFGMGRLPIKRGLYGIWLSMMLLMVAVKIILPIITAEGIRYGNV